MHLAPAASNHVAYETGVYGYILSLSIVNSSEGWQNTSIMGFIKTVGSGSCNSIGLSKSNAVFVLMLFTIDLGSYFDKLPRSGVLKFGYGTIFLIISGRRANFYDIVPFIGKCKLVNIRQQVIKYIV